MDLAKIAMGESIHPLVKSEPIELSDEQRNSLAGTYEAAAEEEKIQVIISVEADGKLYLASAKRYGVWFKYPLIPVKKEDHSLTLVTEIVDEILKIELDQQGKPVKLPTGISIEERTSSIRLNRNLGHISQTRLV